MPVLMLPIVVANLLDYYGDLQSKITHNLAVLFVWENNQSDWPDFFPENMHLNNLQFLNIKLTTRPARSCQGKRFALLLHGWLFGGWKSLPLLAIVKIQKKKLDLIDIRYSQSDWVWIYHERMLQTGTFTTTMVFLTYLFIYPLRNASSSSSTRRVQPQIGSPNQKEILNVHCWGMNRKSTFIWLWALNMNCSLWGTPL